MSKYSELSIEELKNLIKQKNQEWVENDKATEEANSSLYRYRMTGSDIWSALYGIKAEIGRRKGRGCPGVLKNQFYDYRCSARNFKYSSHNLEDLYEKRCYYCKLTKSQARAAKMYNKILKNKNLIPT